MPYDIVTAAAPTSGTLPVSQVITGSLGGATPKAVLIVATRTTTLGTIVDGAMLSIGATDGTNTRGAATMAEDAVSAATADAGMQVSTSKIVMILDTTSETIDGEADVASLGADQIELSWTSLPTSAVQLAVYFFYGSDLDAAVGAIAGSTSNNTAVSVTGLAFRPIGVIFFGCRNAFTTPAAIGLMQLGFGALTLAGGVAGQGAFSWRQADRSSPTVGISIVRDDAVSVRLSTTAEETRLELTAGNADGFDLTTRTGGIAHVTGYLALNFRGRATAGVANLNTDTTGSKDLTVSGLPGIAFFVGSILGTMSTVATSPPCGSFSFGAARRSGGDTCASFESEDAAATSDSRCVTASKLVRVLDDSGATDWDLNVVSGVADTLTVNVGTASPSDRLAPFLVLEDRPSASGGLTTIATALSGAAAERFSASGAMTIDAAIMAGSAAEKFSASGAIAVAAAILNGSASVAADTVTASGNLQVAAALLAGAALEEFAASGNLQSGATVLSGAALEEFAASGALQAAATVLAGSASERFSASGAIQTAAAVLAGLAADKVTASGSIQTAAALLAASALERFSATGAIQIGPVTLSGVALERFVATGQFSVPHAVLSGSATAPVSAVEVVDLVVLEASRRIVTALLAGRDLRRDLSAGRDVVYPLEGSF